MYFDSCGFFCFFLIVFMLVWIAPIKYRRYIIFTSNLMFCLSFGICCLIVAMLISIIGFAFGRLIDKQVGPTRKTMLITSVIMIVALLAFAKYAGVIGNINSLVIPVGMSFYSFRNISYLVDVYKGLPSEISIIQYLDYAIFFPSFSAGPIDRYTDLANQIKHSKEIYDIEICEKSFFLFLWGLFKKAVVAGHMAYYTDWVYGDIRNYSGFTLLLVGFFYSMQIYCDFSGYSDMAIGISGLLGIRLKQNFRHPYFADGIRDFWRRWHISLSTWLKDYIYIPLGGNRHGKLMSNIYLFITFAVSGIWHGASVNFLIWGGIHGLASALDKLFNKAKTSKIRRLIRIMLTFGFVNFAWVVFRLTDFSDIIYYFSHIFEGILNMKEYVMAAQSRLHMDYWSLIRILFILVLVFAYDLFDERIELINWFSNLSYIKRISSYVLLILLIYFLMPVEVATEYIYFKF